MGNLCIRTSKAKSGSSSIFTKVCVIMNTIKHLWCFLTTPIILLGLDRDKPVIILKHFQTSLCFFCVVNISSHFCKTFAPWKKYYWTWFEILFRKLCCNMRSCSMVPKCLNKNWKNPIFIPNVIINQPKSELNQEVVKQISSVIIKFKLEWSLFDKLYTPFKRFESGS